MYQSMEDVDEGLITWGQGVQASVTFKPFLIFSKSGFEFWYRWAYDLAQEVFGDGPVDRVTTDRQGFPRKGPLVDPTTADIAFPSRLDDTDIAGATPKIDH